MRSRHELRQRIANLQHLEERLDAVDWFKRQWLAGYAADVAVIADCLLELVNDQAVLWADDAEAEACDLCSQAHKK